MPEHDDMLLKVNLKQLRLPTILAEFEKLGMVQISPIPGNIDLCLHSV